MDIMNFETARLSNALIANADSIMTDRRFLEREIALWRNSPERKTQICGYLYYEGRHDILRRKRTAIGENGEPVTLDNLPNNRIIDNQYAKMVNQKADYILSQPFVIRSDNSDYAQQLNKVFGRRFMRTMKAVGKAMYNGGIAWLYPCVDENGELSFRLFPSYEILPFWADSEHTRLDMAVRLYQSLVYEGDILRIVENVEVYEKDGVSAFVLENGLLKERNGTQKVPYIVADGAAGYGWGKVPFIPIKANEREIPLISRVKTLQDGINAMLSDFQNNMQEDARNTILVLRNYDGENLGEFRRNLAAYGAVKIRSESTGGGGVDTLRIEVNSDNYEKILRLMKKSLIENAMGYDAKDDRLSGSPNQMNIRSMYSDIDLDANDAEAELQAAFDEIISFVNSYLLATGKGDFTTQECEIIFNRDMLMDEGAIIDCIQKSVGILSNETLIAQHPWVDDVDSELERVNAERSAAEETYSPFDEQTTNEDVTEDEEF